MSNRREMKALALVGSPKGAASNSRPVADYLLKKLNEKGYKTEKMLIYPQHRKDPELKNLISRLDEADLVILVFPLYVDSLPARVIRAFELIYQHRKNMKTEKDQRFMAVCQSGFPEQHQNELALDMCRNFAESSGFSWIGGIPIGGGGMIGEKDLEEAGGRVYFIRNALDIAVDAILSKDNIPEEAISAAAKMPISPKLYKMMGTMGWNRWARKNGLRKKDLYAQPYAKEKI